MALPLPMPIEELSPKRHRATSAVGLTLAVGSGHGMN